MIELAADITPEELQVFLQDTDEQLQLLDEDIIKLENEGDNPDLLQAIFRAAHTIKGSSAMLGYEIMADLTHAMESILDKLRHGELSVTTEIADALLHALDDLRVLRENITAEELAEIDVSAAIVRLENLVSREAEVVLVKESSKPKKKKKSASSRKASRSKGQKKADNLVMMPLAEEGRKRLQESLAMGDKVYQVELSLAERSEWGAVRFFQALNEMEGKGTVILSSPSKEEIEKEKVGFAFKAVYTSLSEEEEIMAVLGEIPDIEQVRICSYDPIHVSDEAEATNAEAEPDATAEAEEILESAATESSRPSGLSEKKELQEGMKVSETVRIDVDRLDSLMNQIGELVVARTAFNRIGNILLNRYRDDEEVMGLSKTLTNVTKIVDDLQLDITEARMMPVGTVFSRFPRLVRDLAQKAGKQIEFIMEGQETGIDRSVIEHIRDPLVHLLRNSVDHGVESPEKRKDAGKPRKATVRLTAAHQQSHIAITVEDDGKGIKGEDLKKKAVTMGVISTEAASRMSDAEAIDLIFEAGLSTAQNITDVSGRGVGMDVVKTNIEALNGNITVETEPGKGSKFTLKLPLTLATINGLLVSSGGITYALPLVMVSETLRLDAQEIQTVTRKEVIRLRDRVVPLIDLDEVLGTNAGKRNGSEMIHVAVVKIGDKMVGLIVDSFREPQEVVVKSLGRFIGEIKGIAGASILGTGEVALILDVPSLIKLVVMRE